MSDAPIIVADMPDSRDNEVRPFQIEGMNVRGRAVRLGTVIDQIITSHNYPDSVNALLGNVLCLTALLGSMLKHDGIVTTQFKGNGAIKLLVADYEYNFQLDIYRIAQEEIYFWSKLCFGCTMKLPRP